VANGARTHLTLYLAGSYLLLIIYASLYPLTGWRDSGDDPVSFLGASWPRYYTGFDLATNVAAYLPFGFLCAATMRRHLATLPAWLLAALLGSALSLVLELLQGYLPNRIPSNLDLACNAAGALLGGWLGALSGARLLDQGHLAGLRRQVMMNGYGVDFGVLLAAAWLLTQISPESLLFGSGNLRQLLDLPPVQPFLAERFVDLETLIAAAGLLAAGLVISMLLRRHARSVTLGLLLFAMVVKTATHALLMGPAAALGWITPGNSLGIGVGLVLWWSATFLGPPLQRAVAALALLLATVMVNVAPENPYLQNMLQIWNPGQFLNFNGLTRLVSSLWPFLALPWLMIYRPRRNESDY
jgi:VanZ family protein